MKNKKKYGKATILGFDSFDILVEYTETESSFSTGSYELPIIDIKGKDLITGSKIEYYEKPYKYLINPNNHEYIKKDMIYVSSVTEIDYNELNKNLKNMTEEDLKEYIKKVNEAKKNLFSINKGIKLSKINKEDDELKNHIRKTRRIARFFRRG